ncbi:MAG: helix-turn-helix domain-containing protein [Faecalibacterium sp.]
MKEVLQYLQEYFDDNASVVPIAAPASLSFALRGNYNFFEAHLLSEHFLITMPTQEISTRNLIAQIARIQAATGTNVAVLLKQTTRYQLKKMLAEGVPFIAESKQLYLPFMALHLQNAPCQTPPAPTKATFSAMAQLLFLAILYADHDRFTAQELAQMLNVSPMTISRAANELQQLGLLQSETSGQTGRKKILVRGAQNEYYRQGKAYLQMPIRETIFLRTLPSDLTVCKSGLTALSEQTMLAEPNPTVCATYLPAAALPTIRTQSIAQEEAQATEGFALQILKYNPTALLQKQNTYLDPISTLLSLTETDERIEQAIETLMEDYAWYEA